MPSWRHELVVRQDAESAAVAEGRRGRRRSALGGERSVLISGLARMTLVGWARAAGRAARRCRRRRRACEARSERSCLAGAY